MKIGFIVGRFQTLMLHQGYIHLISEILKECDSFGIVISKSPLPETRRNPYTIEEREVIIRHNLSALGFLNRFNGFVIVKDNPSDKNWSTELDKALNREAAMFAATPMYDGSGVQVALYGSRDSFIPYYCGNLEVNTITSPFPEISATIEREKVLNSINSRFYLSPEYLAGKLKALHAQYPKVYPTVDVAIFNDHGQVLLGCKPYEDLWRFPGGFTDPTDSCYEAAARREASEECGDIEIDEITYIASIRVDDWRYRSEQDKIITTFFAAKYIYGAVRAGDDLADVDWFNIDTAYEIMKVREKIIPAHRPLFDKLVQYLEKSDNK